MSNSLTTTNPQQLMVMAQHIYESGMFGLKNKSQAFALMCIAEAENIPAIKAVQIYSIINGIPSLKSTEVQARFQRAGGKVKWNETTNQKASVMLTIDGNEYTSVFTMEDAKTMGLSEKDNYKRMPKQMLMARAVTMGVRAIYPECLNNMYTDYEVQDMPKEDIPEAEIIPEIDPQIEINRNKQKLALELEKLGLNKGEIKEFGIKYELGEKVELINELLNDKEKLSKLVEEFEK